MEKLALEYTNKIEETKEFKRLIELKNIINQKYGLLIISLKTKEVNLIEAKERPNIYDVKKCQMEFQDAKIKLYSKEEVKEYFILEEKINHMLEEDMNELKRSISNKYKEYHTFMVHK